MRPSGWHVLDMAEDPTPGDPYGVRVLARSAARMAEDAADAHAAVRSLASDGAVLSWAGLAGEVFRGAIDDFPIQLGKLQDSYEQAADALQFWASRLDDVQCTADQALEQGKQAQAEIDALSAQLATARAQASSAVAASDRLSDQPAGGLPPSPEQLRAATRNLEAAQDRFGSLSSSLSGSQSRLSAAKRMAEQARELKRTTARTDKSRLYDASDAGVQPKSRWEKFKEAAKKAWDITVKIATVVVAVLSVLALVMGGPLVWGILFALSAVLLADSLAKYARGEGSMWDIGLNMLGVIPGGRLLTALGKVSGLTRIGTRATTALSRGLAAGRARLSAMAAGLRNNGGILIRRLGGRRPVGDAGSARLGGPRAEVTEAGTLAATRAQGTRRAAEAGPAVTRSLDDVASLRGATPDDVRGLIPKGWVEKPLKKGEGTRFLNPNRPGEAIMIEKGWPGASDVLHSGPYVRISRKGVVERIPLQGNPVLNP